VERSKLYLERGYSSLFSYCVGRLGYSEHEAMLRIQAMRLVRVMPEVEGRLQAGLLSLSVAGQVQSVVRRERLGPKEARALLRVVGGTSKREAEKKLAELYPSAPKREKARFVAEDAVEIRLTLTREEYEVMQEVLGRRAHSNFERSPGKLFAQLLKTEKAKLQGKQREDASPQRPGKVNSRYVRAPMRRKIWRRDEARCQYRAPDGHQCNERHGLQLDHIEPFALGGASTEANLRLLCGAHNRFRGCGRSPASQ
jgi:5-methylcytosine-specific restriction endonuclease McrA